MALSPSLKWEDAYSIIEPQTTAEAVHVWPFHKEFPIDVRGLRFGLTRQLRFNRHDYYEVFYLHAGEIVCEVQGVRLEVRQGDLLVMGSTLLHRMTASNRKSALGAGLYFLPDLIRAGDRTGEDLQYLMPFLVQDEGFPHVIAASTGIPAQVYDLMKRTASGLPASTTLARLTVRTYLKMILVLLVNHYAAFRGAEETSARRQRAIERLRPLFQAIDRSYADQFSLDDAANLVNMSRSSFMRFFKQVTGQPFVTYLNHFRVSKAETLLRTTDLSIAEVGLSVGFCDQSYFGMVFRSVMGVTPREFKQRGQGGTPNTGRVLPAE